MLGFVFSLNEHAAAAMNQADYQTGTERLFRPPPENKTNFPGRVSCRDHDGSYRVVPFASATVSPLFSFLLVQLISMEGPADGRRPDPDPGRIGGAAAAGINTAERADGTESKLRPT